MRVELQPPLGDKGYALHFHDVPEQLAPTIRSLVCAPRDKRLPAHPFLQGDSGTWLMVEFWTSDMEAINRAVAATEEKLGCTVLRVEPTRRAPRRSAIFRCA